MFQEKGIFVIKNKIENIINKVYKKTLQKNVLPILGLSPEAIICAKIANESYKKPNKREKIIEGYLLDSENSTSDIAIYIDKIKKICILGYRGTIFTNVQDLISDAQIILDIQGIDARVKSGLHTYDKCKRTFIGYVFWVCGHSLGGTLSYIIGKHREPDKCIVFNPGIAPNTFFFEILEDSIKGSARTQKTETYKIFGDIISTAAFVGKTKVFMIKSKDPIKSHGIQNFINKKVLTSCSQKIESK